MIAHRRLFSYSLILLYPFFLFIELAFVLWPLAEMLIVRFVTLFHALFFVLYPIVFSLLLLSIRTRTLNKLLSFFVLYSYLLPYYYASRIEKPFEFFHAFYLVPLVFSSMASLLIALAPYVYEYSLPGILAVGGKSMRPILRYVRSREFFYFLPFLLLIPFASFYLYPLSLLVYLAFRGIIVRPWEAMRLIASEEEIRRSKPIRGVLVLPASPGGYALAVIANLGTLSLLMYLSISIVAANIRLYTRAIEFVSVTSLPAVIALAMRRTLIGLKMRLSRAIEEREKYVVLRFAL